MGCFRGQPTIAQDAGNKYLKIWGAMFYAAFATPRSQLRQQLLHDTQYYVQSQGIAANILHFLDALPTFMAVKNRGFCCTYLSFSCATFSDRTNELMLPTAMTTALLSASKAADQNILREASAMTRPVFAGAKT
jgi:hypothetical protein